MRIKRYPGIALSEPLRLLRPIGLILTNGNCSELLVGRSGQMGGIAKPSRGLQSVITMGGPVQVKIYSLLTGTC